MTEPEQTQTCPRCGSHDVRRSHTHGLIAKFMLAMHKRPYRCRSCRHKYYLYEPRPAAAGEEPPYSA